MCIFVEINREKNAKAAAMAGKIKRSKEMRAKLFYYCRQMKKAILLAGLAGGLLLVFVTEMKSNDWEKDGLKGKVKKRIIYSYDLEEKFGEMEKKVRGKTIHKYDYNGNMIEHAECFSDGSFCRKQKYKYDDNGNMIEESNNSDRSLGYKIKWKYDDNGNMIEEAEYNSYFGLEYKIKYKYDSNGNRIERSWYSSDGSLEEKYHWKYDDNGNKIGEVHYDSDGNIMHKSEYKYKYDSNGNIIEGEWYEYEFKFGKGQEILKYYVKYEYEYYE